MSKDPFQHTKYATTEEACRGIYIDFEGFQNHSPALIGIYTDGILEQVVLDPKLSLPAKYSQLRVSSLEEIINELLDKAGKENRRIFGFTRHEYNKVQEWTNLGDAFLAAYADGHKIAKRWAKKEYPDRKISRSLIGFAELIGIEYPTYFGYRKATKKLRAIYDRSEKKSTYDEISSGGKRSWTILLDYNEWDCLTLYKLMQAVFYTK